MPKHEKGIQRTGFMRRTGRLPAQSAKGKKQAAQRRRMLAQHPSDLCAAARLVPEITCAGPLDPHEPLTRARGGSITDPSNLAWVCRAHHDWAHDNPDEAHEVGLLKHSWEA
jgi:hypothetical protein